MEKKFLNSLRNWLLLIITMTIPIIFVTVAIVISRSWGGNRDLPKLALTLNTYNPTVTTIEYDSKSPNESMEAKIFKNYRKQFEGDGFSVDEISKDMVGHYLRKSNEFLARVNNRYLFGVTIGKPNITVWYSNQPYHTSPISLSLLHNAVLTAVVGRTCRINVTNKPLAYRAETRMMMLQTVNNLGVQLSINVGVAMVFVASLFIIAYIKERVTKAKLLQFVSGINVVIYWMTAFVWDYFLFVFIAILTTTVIGAFQEKGYSTLEELSRIFIVILVFGFAMLPFVYVSAFLFRAPASGFSGLATFLVLASVAMFAVVFSLGLDAFDMKHVADILTWILSLIPHFALIDAMSNININNVMIDVCQRQCDMTGACADVLCAINPTCCSKIVKFGFSFLLTIFFSGFSRSRFF